MVALYAFFGEETASHFIIVVMPRVWSAIPKTFGIPWVMPRTITDLFSQWRLKGGMPRQIFFMESFFICWYLEDLAGMKWLSL